MVEQPRGWLSEEELKAVDHARAALKTRAEVFRNSHDPASASLCESNAAILLDLLANKMVEQPRGWLTPKDREWLIYINQNVRLPGGAHPWLKSFLARSSPPEVVKPGVWRVRNDPQTTMTWQPFLDDVVAKRDAEWIAAHAAAGVAVKEVG
jgi:hypothetical protein